MEVAVSDCKGCGVVLRPSEGPRPRVWCSEACRKRGAQTENGAGLHDFSGDVEIAVTEKLDAWNTEPVMRALSVALARIVDRGGPMAVSAARELRIAFHDAEEAARAGHGLIDQLRESRERRHAENAPS
jgi:hypothetical protein